MTCDALLDHRCHLDDEVRSCIRKSGHKEPHFPGDWRRATVEEAERIRRASARVRGSVRS